MLPEFQARGPTIYWHSKLACIQVFKGYRGEIGRSERIRTSGPCVPNTVLYQAELHSDRGRAYSPPGGG